MFKIHYSILSLLIFFLNLMTLGARAPAVDQKRKLFESPLLMLSPTSDSYYCTVKVLCPSTTVTL